MAFVAKGVMTELSPVNLATMRWFVAAMPFLILLPVMGRPKVPFERRDMPLFLAVVITKVIATVITVCGILLLRLGGTWPCSCGRTPSSGSWYGTSKVRFYRYLDSRTPAPT